MKDQLTNEQLDQEIASLLERRKKLFTLSLLRREVNALEQGKRPVTQILAAMNVIIEAVAQDFGIDRELMMSRDRHAYVAYPRMTVFYIALRLTSIRPCHLAREYKFDHSAISYASRAIGDKIDTDMEFRLRVENLVLACSEQLETINQ
jgi:chromosomal replication initiation ATPase DnaA